MIPSFALLALGVAWAQEPAPPEAEPLPGLPEAPPPDSAEPEGVEPAVEPEEDPLSKYRVPFQVLANRTIGTVSAPVAFDWRRTKVHFGATGSFLFELNTFNSARVGGLVRVPVQRQLLEFGLNYVEVWDSESSEVLAQTAFRQPGRPSRFEIDARVVIPLAEGIVTAMPRWFPSAQLAFNATVGLRYSFYPLGFSGLSAGQVTAAVFSPTVTVEEIDNLDEAGQRLGAMLIDSGRYGLTAGFSNDIYFERGIFVSPRVEFAVPALAPVSGSQLPFWVDVNLAVGVAL